ncbi:MAG: slipin family protein [Acidobacteriota bacterium]|nr:slipin family protein [Acidobacteriota bacterium]
MTNNKVFQLSNQSAAREVIIKDSHRGLYYEDGVLLKILEAGRHVLVEQEKLSFRERVRRFLIRYKAPRKPEIEVQLVDVRERDLTIKGQEILTADKVALRVSVIVQFRITDPRAAIHAVENYEERLYSDVQLAARRSLATMSLEELLTNRNKLSEDILNDVKEAAAGYGALILRADIKDLVFPGNLQEIMNRVLAAERNSEVHLVEARAKAEIQKIEAQTKAESARQEAESAAASRLAIAKAEAEAINVQTAAEIQSLREREKAAQAYSTHPALLRLRELETLSEMARTAEVKMLVGFDKHLALEKGD